MNSGNRLLRNPRAESKVGRNYMRHNMSVLMALLKEPNNTVFQKTLALSDFYSATRIGSFLSA